MLDTRSRGVLTAFSASVLLLVSCDRGDPSEASSRTLAQCSDASFNVGAGIYDITGRAAEAGMMGYAQLAQTTAGIHTRLRSRAFVVASPCTGSRVAFVSADLDFISQGVKQQVIERLRARFGETYRDANVLLSATHTHSGPGGYSHYAFYNLTTLGFDPQTFEAIVSGIVEAIVRADGNLEPARLSLATGDLLGASVNRSPEAYLRNPESERARYTYDVDTGMTLLRFDNIVGGPLGMVSWFPVHGTSMGNDNHLISGDNKGFASYMFERLAGTDYRAPRTFVAAFAQSHSGDVSPNIYGGEDGGGADDFESTELSGRKQLDRAVELFHGANQPLRGAVDARHVYLAMDNLVIEPERADGQPRHTCEAAIGISMLAGAEDGPGFGREGTTCESPPLGFEWITCNTFTTDCQAEKPIMLETSTMRPHPWTPEVLPLQLVRMGQLVLVAVPFELTTMAGRRLKQTIAAEMHDLGVSEVVISGPSNAYAGYVTTREEYAAQQYEGASSHFGPWTLAALQQEFAKLARSMRDGFIPDAGPEPRDLRNEQLTVRPGVVLDTAPLFRDFGDVFQGPRSSYQRGETVQVTFWGAHLANDLMTQSSYIDVQRWSGSTWDRIADDGDWETRVLWRRPRGGLLGCSLSCSHVDAQWRIPHDAPAGAYRIVHRGVYKNLLGSLRSYSGASSTFTID